MTSPTEQFEILWRRIPGRMVVHSFLRSDDPARYGLPMRGACEQTAAYVERQLEEAPEARRCPVCNLAVSGNHPARN